MTARQWTVAARLGAMLALASMTSCALWASKNEPSDADEADGDVSMAAGAAADGSAFGPDALIAAPRGVLVNRVIATLDGEPVTMIEFETFRARYDANPANESAGALDDSALLDQLLMDKIFEKQVEEQGLTASDEQVEDYLESIRSRNQLTEDQLRNAVEARGFDYEAYIEQVRTDIERANLVNKEIRARVNVTPEEVERYYEAHLPDYALSPRVHVRLISLVVPPDASSIQREVFREKIDEIHAEAAGGANFAKLAKQHSQGPGAEDGGDLGVMDRGEMQSAFDEAAFTLDTGEVSDVIETDTGYHILKVEEHLAESYTALEDVQDDIREELYRKAMEERYDRWLTKDLRERHHIEILL